jgi:hypothetical protein
LNDKAKREGVDVQRLRHRALTAALNWECQAISPKLAHH